MANIQSLDQANHFGAYIATPAGTPKAAIIVIQEIFGVNAGIRQKCDHWASLGYVAVAPDLFWRMAPNIELDPDIEAELQQGFGYFQRYNPDDGIKDIQATLTALRQGIDGHAPIIKIGLVGYCLGGRLAYMASCRTNVDASVGYYGVMIDQMLDEAAMIAKPLLLHIPTADGFVSPEAQAAMHKVLDRHPQVTLYDYPGLNHGFATEAGNRRNDAAATLADSRTVAFFEKNLR